MLMEKPQCNFQNCRYCFDGNCISADKYENCKLTDLHCEIARLTVDLDNEKSEWISVEERLPEETQGFLVVLNNEDIDIRVFNHKTEPLVTYPMMFNKFIVLDTHNEWWIENKVTHWMPLPMPPTEKGGEG